MVLVLYDSVRKSSFLYEEAEQGGESRCYLAVSSFYYP